MVESNAENERVTMLAEKVVADIRQRGLCSGDRYLTTDEVSRMLGAHKAAVNSAMRYLADRKLLVRRQRSGTFVGPRFSNPERSRVNTLFVLLPGGDPVAAQWSQSPFIQGIHREWAGLNVQFSFVPEHDGVGYVRELVESAQSSGQFAGVVPISCRPEVYRYLDEIGVPAVAYGTLYKKTNHLASIDLDCRQAGRLLAEYVLKRGHRRVALFLAATGRPGDSLFCDGINEVFLQGREKLDLFLQRHVPNDLETLQVVAGEMWELPSRPTAVLTRGRLYADAIRVVAREAGLSVPEEVEIVYDHEGQTTARHDQASLPYVRPTKSFVEIATMIGNMLRRISEDKPLEKRHVVIPVELFEPAEVHETWNHASIEA